MKRIVFIFAAFFDIKVSAQNLPVQIEALMNYANREFNFNGVVLVAQKNQVLYEKAYGKANLEWNISHANDSKFRIGSISKQFTAFIILQLCKQGKLSINDRVSKYIEAFTNTDKSDITIQHLLTHTSGLADYTGLENFNERIPYADDSIVKLIVSAPPRFSSSEKFNYSNSNYFILAVVAEKITGKPFKTLLEENILGPAEMKNSGEDEGQMILDKMSSSYVKKDTLMAEAPWLEMKNTKGGGGLYSTASDLLKWSVFFQEQLSKNSLARSTIQPYHLRGGGQTIYSSGWCLLSGLLFHTGHINGFASLIAIDTVHQQTIILLSNSGYHQLFITLLSIRNILGGDVHALDWLKHKALLRNDYSGTYSIGSFKVEIKNDNPDLAAYPFGQKERLRSFMKDDFFSIDQEQFIKFNRDEQGNIISVSSFQDYEWVELKKIQ